MGPDTPSTTAPSPCRYCSRRNSHSLGALSALPYPFGTGVCNGLPCHLRQGPPKARRMYISEGRDPTPQPSWRGCGLRGCSASALQWKGAAVRGVVVGRAVVEWEGVQRWAFYLSRACASVMPLYCMTTHTTHNPLLAVIQNIRLEDPVHLERSTFALCVCLNQQQKMQLKRCALSACPSPPLPPNRLSAANTTAFNPQRAPLLPCGSCSTRWE